MPRMHVPAATRFLRACRREPVDRVPVWMMRQAGRYMPEYQLVRRQHDLHTMFRDPALAAQVTLDAYRYLKTDAAIIFSDITLPADAMGCGLTFAPGPRFARPVRSQRDVAGLLSVDPARDLGFVLDAIKRTRAELPSDVSLIGFVGAPLTLAGYMIEGDPTGGWHAFKRAVYGEPGLVEGLLERVSEVVAAHAAAQVAAGCDAVQLFDTLAGELAAAEVHAYAFRHAARVVAALKRTGAPVLYFARNIGAHLAGAAAVGADVLALDWTVSVREARQRLNDGIALMGNLDPDVLLTTPPVIDERVRLILEEAQRLKGFVFNLGHGVLPATPPEHARQVVLSVERHGRVKAT